MTTEIVYKISDLESAPLKSIIADAAEVWRNICKINFALEGACGSCVLGAGIYVMATAPRQRKPRKHFIIEAVDVAQAQGSLNWERGKDSVLAYLRERGIAARYDWGFSD